MDEGLNDRQSLRLFVKRVCHFRFHFSLFTRSFRSSLPALSSLYMYIFTTNFIIIVWIQI